MYIWLKEGAEEKLQALKEKGLVGGNLLVQTDRISGEKHITTYATVSDPTINIPECLGELTEKVTAQESIFNGFRADGVYRHNGATLVATTEISHPSNHFYQKVNISGPSVEMVKTIYSLFRQGKLAPEENWEEGAPVAPRATETADETEEATA